MIEWILNLFDSQNEVNIAEGELSMVDDNERIRELQDRVGDLKAEVLNVFRPEELLKSP